ncbi:MAG: MBL fold metallo-hydrolase [Hyphomicrobiaceae bacterium]
MVALSRRQLVLSATTAAATLGLDRRFTFLGASPAWADSAMDAGFLRFKVGDIEMTALFDGAWVRDHDPGFIKNASVDETKAALAAAGLPTDKVTIPFSVMVARIGDRTVMFDSGTGGQLAPTAGLIMTKGMAAAGIDPASIATIAVTHYHPDHIFGMMAKDTNAPVFPNAEIIVPAAEHEWWTDESVFTKLPEARHGLAKRIKATLGTWSNVRPVGDDVEILPGVRTVASHGHTPGHTSYHLSSGSEQLMVLGDVSNIPALFLSHPGWHASFDADPVMAEETRRRMMDRVVADKLMVAGYHYPFPAAGNVARDGEGYTFAPIA